MTGGFVEALMEAPMGVVTLAAIESRVHRGPSIHFFGGGGSDPENVERAVEWVRAASVGEVFSLAVRAGEDYAGPWNPIAPGEVAAAYRNAKSRLPIAAALIRKFGDTLHEPIDPGGQEWWTTDRAPHRRGDDDLLWTATRPPAEAHDDVVSVWELHPPPTSRWRVEIEGWLRVKEIHRPADWVDLVERWPDTDADMYKRYGTWEFKSPGPRRRRLRLSRRPNPVESLVRVAPGPLGWLSGLLPRHRAPEYDEEAQIRELLAVPGQHAAYPSPSRLVGVDWRAAAEHYDAVHLSWAGFLTTEGYVSELADGSVTMLRGFASERTLWLSDVFAPVPAVPLSAPEGLTGDISDDRGIDVSADGARAARDRLNLEVMLGRREVPSPPAAEDPAPRRRRMWRR